jgi:hypothetical protein
MTVPFDARVSVPADVLVQELDGESVLLNLNGGLYYGLDDVGTRIWAALTKCQSVEHAYETLLTEFDVEPDLLKKDLVALVEKLIENGLVELG